MKVMDEISVSIPANSTNQNVLTGRRYERGPFTGLATFFSTGSAAGLEEEYNIGSQSITPRITVNTQNRSPMAPDDLRLADVPVYQGQLVQVSVTNTTGGALTYRLRIEVEQAE